MNINVEGKRGRRKPKKRWLDKINNNNMKAVGVCVGNIESRDQ